MRSARPAWAVFGALALRAVDIAVHSARGAVLAEILSSRMGHPVEEGSAWAFLLRDVGTTDVPSEILQKPGELDRVERMLISSHPVASARLILQMPGLEKGTVVALHHHERWDGSGYPDGLSEDDIPQACRIIAVADAWAAMTAPRPHRPARPAEDAIRALETGSGTQFDPDVVEAFLEILRDLPPRLRIPPPVEATGARWILPHAERAEQLSRGQLEALFAVALGMDAVHAAELFGRTPGTQRNWASSLRRTLACPHRMPLPHFLTTVGHELFEAMFGEIRTTARPLV